MRILLTGGSGQIGTALRHAADTRVDLVAPASRELDVGDARSVEAAFDAIRPEVVVNAAAYTAVDRAEDESELAFRVNAKGPELIASACRRHSAYLIHLSTDYVFDGTKSGAYTEADVPNPQGVYGKSKLEGESAALATWSHTLVLRVSWVFSETGKNFVKTIVGLAQDRETLKIVDDQWGTPCSARAISDMILRAINRHRDEDPLVGIYHFATTPRTNWFEFARAIVAAAKELELIHREPSIQPISTREFGARAPRPANSVLESSRLQQALGLDITDWRDELRHTMDGLVEAPRANSRHRSE
jgi:dTDP-4-dehydrorhamnose reductase